MNAHTAAPAQSRAVWTLAICALLLASCLTSWAASEKVLYAFHGTDGCGPNSVMVASDGVLYGTTASAGSSTCSAEDIDSGAVFQLTRESNGKWSETVLHFFSGSDGWAPVGPLVADKAGNLYGATAYGGLCSQLGCGVVFELVRGTGDNWTFQVLHYFNVSDGANPYAGVILDSKGNLYGTTSGGGNNACDGGCGVVFELSPAGEGKWTETVLYTFDASDGANPGGPLTLDSSDNLYGTTELGGYGGGTAFKLSRRNGQWNEEILHSFDFDTKDGDEPAFGVTFDHSGNLYGTTPLGGMEGQQGWGTAFKLTPAGGGKWKETIVHRFNRASFDGGLVSSGLVPDDQGNLYGSTNWGGNYDCPGGGGLGCGTVFKLTHSGGQWSESVLHSFGKENDGAFPGPGPVRNSAGLLFGVAQGGYTGDPCGQYGCGVVFEITP